MDGSGNLYGTTQIGGTHDGGTAFELIPNADTGKWTEKVLYSFCAKGGSTCTDGSRPSNGLIMDGSGNLYGTTLNGGSRGDGTAFELIPNADTGKWTEKVLYSFCAKGGSNCTDGLFPEAGLIMDGSGNLYGTTLVGGSRGAGTAFELIPNADTGKWSEKVLFGFCAGRGVNCPDGSLPAGGLIMDGSGNLYGTTSSGGTPRGGTGDGGTAFELIPNADTGKWTEKVLHSFCAKDGSKCPDGSDPSNLIMDGAGNLYGATYVGGSRGGGTAFELIPNADTGKWTVKVLHSFCDQGEHPCSEYRSGLIMDRAGNLYGTTAVSRLNGGTVYELMND